MKARMEAKASSPRSLPTITSSGALNTRPPSISMFASRSNTRSFGTSLDGSDLNVQALSTPKKQPPRHTSMMRSLLSSSKSGQREINDVGKLTEEKNLKKCEIEPSSSSAADDDFVEELNFQTLSVVPKHDDAAVDDVSGTFEAFLDQLKSHGLEECHGILFASGYCRMSDFKFSNVDELREIGLREEHISILLPPSESEQEALSSKKAPINKSRHFNFRSRLVLVPQAVILKYLSSFTFR